MSEMGGSRHSRWRPPRRVVVTFAVLGSAAAAAIVAVSSVQRESATGLGHGQSVAGAPDVGRLLAGLHRDGAVLGDADAPLTLNEFVDLQSPASEKYANEVLPPLVERYVRSGRVRIKRHVVAIFDGSDQAAAWAGAAAARNRLFEFSETFLRNQGHEDEDYLTPEFLDSVAEAVDLDSGRMRTLAEGFRVRARVAADTRAFKRYELEATPSFVLGRTSDMANAERITDPSVDGFRREIERLDGGAR